jgi:hypothetical protein
MPHLSAEAYLTVASITAGFGVTVFMFRVQRELTFENNPDDTRLAWADYLILASISLALVGAVLPLMLAPDPGPICYRLAAASCAASSVLLLAYPFAILDHYRIEWGKRRFRTSPSHAKGEPLEKALVVVSAVVAALLFAGILLSSIM